MAEPPCKLKNTSWTLTAVLFPSAHTGIRPGKSSQHLTPNEANSNEVQANPKGCEEVEAELWCSLPQDTADAKSVQE